MARGIRALARRGTVDREIAEEVRHYMEAAEAELTARGATPEEARRRVRLKYGDPGVAREEVRAYGWENVVGSLAADVRYGARRLRRSPGFTTVAVLTLSLGIGASTAIFGAASPVLFEPLRYPRADRLVELADEGTGGSTIPVTFGTYLEISRRGRSFEALAVGRAWQPIWTGGDEPRRLEGRRVSGDYFRVLGVAPALGPGFDPADDRSGGPDVVILGAALWRDAFGADSAIVGRAIRLDDRPFTVVGVMPPGFEDVPGRPAETWAQLQYDASLPAFEGREWGHHLDMIARLRPAVDLETARAELATIAERPVPGFARPAWATMGRGLSVRGLQEAATEGVRPALFALLGAVVLLLAIACMNVTSLVLARGARRRGELALRAALGAARGRVVRQLLVESLLLAALGGVVGVGIARLGMAILVSLSPPGLPGPGEVGLDGAVLAFALGITTLVGVAVGLAPALADPGGDLRTGLRQAPRGGAGSLSPRRALVVAEVALAIVLLVGAGLLLRSTQRLFDVEPGFAAAHRLAVKVQVAGSRFDDEATHRFYDQVLDAVRGVPGVVSAAVTGQLPLSGDPEDRYGVRLEDDPRPAGADRAADRYAVTPGYLRAMGMSLLAGRFLDERDVADAPPVVVVDQALARSAFPGRDPVGERIQVGGEAEPGYVIVGVVGDVKRVSLADVPTGAVYVAPTQWRFADRSRWIVVHAEGDDPAALTGALKRAIWAVDPDQPIVRVATLAGLVADSDAKRRFATVVLRGFAAVALVLAALGLYGVLAGGVAERAREIGVRAALGASRRRLVGMVVREGMALTAAGVTIGLLVAAFASRLLASLLFGVSPLDPATHLGVVALLVGVAAVASWIPAARAAGVDPASALHTE